MFQVVYAPQRTDGWYPREDRRRLYEKTYGSSVFTSNRRTVLYYKQKKITVSKTKLRWPSAQCYINQSSHMWGTADTIIPRTEGVSAEHKEFVCCLIECPHLHCWREYVHHIFTRLVRRLGSSILPIQFILLVNN